MKPMRVLALMHPDLVPPDDIKVHRKKESPLWKTEYDVVTSLRESGHEVLKLGVAEDLGKIRVAVEEFKPHIAFNLLEEFHGNALYDQHVVSYLELLKLPYTGCNPRGLTLAHDKALSKKILSYHRIPTPAFAVIPRGRKPRKPKRLQYPLIVKSLIEEASLGISQASIVTSDEKLFERVAFIHDSIQTDALIEEYIEGRELYQAILGNHRLEMFPLWELWFEKLPEGSQPIATQKAKWDEAYQEKVGLKSEPARKLSPELQTKIQKICKRAYKALGITGYARIDLRVTDDQAYILEVNANPDLSFDEEFSMSSYKAGYDYDGLISKILTLGRSFARS